MATYFAPARTTLSLEDMLGRLPISSRAVDGVARIECDLSAADPLGYLARPLTVALCIGPTGTARLESSLDAALAAGGHVSVTEVLAMRTGEVSGDFQRYLGFLLLNVSTAWSAGRSSPLAAAATVGWTRPQTTPVRDLLSWQHDRLPAALLDTMWAVATADGADTEALAVARTHRAGDRLYNLLAGRRELREMVVAQPVLGWALASDNISLVARGLKLRDVTGRLLAQWTLARYADFAALPEQADLSVPQMRRAFLAMPGVGALLAHVHDDAHGVPSVPISPGCLAWMKRVKLTKATLDNPERRESVLNLMCSIAAMGPDIDPNLVSKLAGERAFRALHELAGLDEAPLVASFLQNPAASLHAIEQWRAAHSLAGYATSDIYRLLAFEIADTKEVHPKRFAAVQGLARQVQLAEDYHREIVARKRDAVRADREARFARRHAHGEDDPALIDTQFPAPPFLGGTDGQYTLVWLDTPRRLDEEGAAMGHCVGGAMYAKRCRSRASIIYGVRDAAGKRLATWEVSWQYTTKQLQGPRATGRGGAFEAALLAIVAPYRTAALAQERERDGHLHLGVRPHMLPRRGVAG